MISAMQEMNSPSEMKPVFINDRTRILIAVACTSFGAAVLMMGAIGWHYDSKIKAIRDQHRDEVSSMRRAHKKELKERDNIIECLKKIDLKIDSNRKD